MRREPTRDLPDVPGYVLEEPIGRGGFGTVFRARDVRDGTAVAVKISGRDPLAAARLRVESEALRRLGPPITPAWFGCGELSHGDVFVAMELIAHPLLAQRLSELEGGAIATGTRAENTKAA